MCDMTSQYIDQKEEETNPEHDRLIEHLRGLRRIVVNTQHGGFGLSHEGQIEYLERSNIAYTLEDRESRDATLRLGQCIKVNGNHWADYNVARDNPVLISVVEDLKDRANGTHANLRIVQVPADVRWVIEEYDGKEWVAEQHRTWD